MGKARILVAAAVMAWLGSAPSEAGAQARVRSDDGIFEYVMQVNRRVYGLIDTVHVSYTVHNITDTTQVMNVCCCGVEFFAVRDSACTFGGDGCEIAGCDACPVCFEGDGCSFDPCSPITIKSEASVVFTWDWSRDVCPWDFGFDPVWGNAGTFRLVTGYHVCDAGPGLQNALDMPITVLKQVATFPRTWGSVKALYRNGGGDRIRRPG